MLRSYAARSTRSLRVNARPFSASAVSRVEGYPSNASTNAKTKTDQYPDDEHSVNKAKKGDTNDIQTSNLKDGLEYVSLISFGSPPRDCMGVERLSCAVELFILKWRSGSGLTCLQQQEAGFWRQCD